MRPSCSRILAEIRQAVRREGGLTISRCGARAWPGADGPLAPVGYIPRSMSKAPPTSEKIEPQLDGRIARRERNQKMVLDVVIQLFGEEELFPTIEQVSKRSGLSLRSLYRYFADPGELLEAAIERTRELNLRLGDLPSIGEGTLDKRISDYTAMCLRLYEQAGPVHRATVHNAPHHPRIRDALQAGRQRQRRQFELQFAPELNALAGAQRESILAAGDLLTQIDSIDLLRRDRQLTVAETQDVLRAGLAALLRQGA